MSLCSSAIQRGRYWPSRGQTETQVRPRMVEMTGGGRVHTDSSMRTAAPLKRIIPMAEKVSPRTH
jgi:hypothetical protein